jgi:hypothetical protein
MYSGVQCFWVEPNGKADRSLRRYGGEGCPLREGAYTSSHNASVDIGQFDVIRTEPNDEGIRYIASIPVDEYLGDPRWPTHCECGYEFQADDKWQVNQDEIYIAEDGRQTYIRAALGRKPLPGAMFDTFWRPNARKEDGLAISVILPNGLDWCIDGEASSGGFWERTGTPPNLTVSPSIQGGDYHGYLRDGALTDG